MRPAGRCRRTGGWKAGPDCQGAPRQRATDDGPSRVPQAWLRSLGKVRKCTACESLQLGFLPSGRSGRGTGGDGYMTVQDNEMGLAVTDGDFTVVLTSDGTWKVDAGRVVSLRPNSPATAKFTRSTRARTSGSAAARGTVSA